MRDQDKGKRSAPRWKFWGGQNSAVDTEFERHHSWHHALAFFKEFISAIVPRLDPTRNRSGHFNPLKFPGCATWESIAVGRLPRLFARGRRKSRFLIPCPVHAD